MKSTFSLTFAAATALFAATNVIAGDQTAEGCFSSSTGLTFNGTSIFNSKGSCGTACLAKNYAVMAMTNSTYCYCSQTLPPASTKGDDTDCTISCPGYPDDTCGAPGYWSVYLTGMTTVVKNADASSSDKSSSNTKSSSASTTSTAKPSVVTVGGQTVVVTAASESSASAAASSSSSSSSPSKAGIAAGVVVGVLAIAAIGGGGFLFLRNRKRRQIEEEYKRNAAVSSFIAGGKPPTSSDGSSFNDLRLDPAVMAQRRMSDGSIADNQDYSRRILKVTNA